MTQAHWNRQEAERAEKERQRRAAAVEKERKRLHLQRREQEAENMSVQVRECIAELDNVLLSSLHKPTTIAFSALRRTLNEPSFDSRGLDRPVAPPTWAEFAPPPPRWPNRLLGGQAQHQRRQSAARQEFQQQLAQHEVAEQERQRQLAELRRAHTQQLKRLRVEIDRHNAKIDQFERDFLSGKAPAVSQYFGEVLAASDYPEGIPRRYRLGYRSEPKELFVEYRLPDQSIIPIELEYRYVPKRDAIEPVSRTRPIKEIKQRYAALIARIALRTLREVFDAGWEDLVVSVVFNGHVSAKDRATGQSIHPCLVSISATRENFAQLVLSEPDLDPVLCLRHLNALVSPHPYDLEAVRPVVDFDLSQYPFVEEIDAVAGLDSRPDLLDMKPVEFEHLVRQLFEAMGMKSWVTQASRDDGVDAVAVNEDPIMGGLCVIQAKRYRSLVGVESVRALAGVMDDKHATKSILVTTSWYGKTSRDFVSRHGRIQLIEGNELKYLLKEHLDLDVLIGLPKNRSERP